MADPDLYTGLPVVFTFKVKVAVEPGLVWGCG